MGTDLKRILPVMVAPGCRIQRCSGRLEAFSKDRRANRQAGKEGAGTLLGAYHSSSLSLANNEIIVGKLRHRKSTGLKAKMYIPCMEKRAFEFSGTS